MGAGGSIIGWMGPFECFPCDVCACTIWPCGIVSIVKTKREDECLPPTCGSLQMTPSNQGWIEYAVRIWDTLDVRKTCEA
jgi:hypothetical protein